MRIQHNISALNTHRNLGFNNTQSSKNLEKLSSGFKINRAGDDAAGLAISEKMRGQIRGLDMATKNANDSISLIQTAEGALNETHSILQRMRELAVQSSNDTNVTDDREALQKEISELTKEIDRIADTTEFNTQKLLNGGFKGTFQIGANAKQTLDMNIGSMNAATLGLTATTQVATDVTTNTLKDGTYTVKGNNIVDVSGNNVGTIAVNKFTPTGGTEVDLSATVTTLAKDGTKIEVKDGKATINQPASEDVQKLAAGEYEIAGGLVLKDGQTVGTYATNVATIKLGDGSSVAIDKSDLGIVKEVGATGATKFTVNGVSISSRQEAEGSISKIDEAIKKVSAQRSSLGAVQNRLEHTINNLGAASENLTAAESRIRDTDMAKEMMEFTKNNILTQAAQSMLAQANQQPQGVLQLLG